MLLAFRDGYKPACCRALSSVHVPDVRWYVVGCTNRGAMCMSATRSSDTERSRQYPISYDDTTDGDALDGRARLSQCLSCLGLVTASASVVFAGLRGYTLDRQVPCFASITLGAVSPNECRKPQHQAFEAGAIFKYRLLQLFSMPTYGKLLAVIAVGVPIVVIGGLVYNRITGLDLHTSMEKVCWTLNDCPGADITQEDSGAAKVTMMAIYLCSVFLFAVVVGVVTDDVSKAVEELHCGNYQVCEEGHSVILGWNAQTVPLLRQMVSAHEEGCPGLGHSAVVVLAERSKEEMDLDLEEIHCRFRNAGMKLITRSGSPSKLDNLSKVAVGSAGIVIVLHPQGEEDALVVAQKAATLAAVKAMGAGKGNQRVVIQSSMTVDALSYNAALLAMDLFERPVGRPGVPPPTCLALVPSLERISQIKAQVTFQPELGRVFSDLLEFEGGRQGGGAELYAKQFPEFAGLTFGDVRHLFPRATLCGYVSASSGQSVLNPSDHVMMTGDDVLVFVAPTMSEVVPLSSPYEPPAPPRLTRRQSAAPLAHKHVVLLSFGQCPERLLDQLAEFAPRGGRITVLSSEGVVEGRRGQAYVKSVVGHPASQINLMTAGVHHADAVVVMGLAELPLPNPDAQAVALALQLQKIAQDAAHHRHSPLDVIISIGHPNTSSVLAHVLDIDRQGTPGSIRVHTVSPDDILAGMITQVAAAPQLNAVFQELFQDAAGCEVYLRQPKQFGLPLGADLTWSTLQEVVRSRGELLLGTVRSREAIVVDEDQEGLQGDRVGHTAAVKHEELWLSPPVDAKVKVTNDELLVVLAQSY